MRVCARFICVLCLSVVVFDVFVLGMCLCLRVFLCVSCVVAGK